MRQQRVRQHAGDKDPRNCRHDDSKSEPGTPNVSPASSRRVVKNREVWGSQEMVLQRTLRRLTSSLMLLPTKIVRREAVTSNSPERLRKTQISSGTLISHHNRLRSSRLQDFTYKRDEKEAAHAGRGRLPVNCWDWPEADCVPLPERRSTKAVRQLNLNPNELQSGSEVRPQPPHCDKNSYILNHLLSSVKAIIK